MTQPKNDWRPPVYVILFGVLYGANIALAKFGGQDGVHPVTLAFWQMLGAGVCLSMVCFTRRVPIKLDAHHIRYYLIAGLVGNAIPTALSFAAASEIGAGLTGLVYPLSPVFTYVFAVALGHDRWQSKMLQGLALGLLGALCVILPQAIGDAHADVSLFWLSAAFSIPIFLGIGNIYRSVDWPKGTPSLPLASGMLLATALILAAVAPAVDAPLTLSVWSDHTLIFSAVVTLSVVGFVIYFELQRIAGPVYFSQISFPIALTTLAFGLFALGESPHWSVGVATVLIFGGLYRVNQGRAESS